MSGETLTQPDVQLHTGQNPDEVAHYVKKRRVTDAAVFGEPIPALCGYIVIPSRDTTGMPVCEACRAIFDDDAAREARGGEMR